MALQGAPPILAPPSRGGGGREPKGVKGGIVAYKPPPLPRARNIGPLRTGIGPLPRPAPEARGVTRAPRSVFNAPLKAQTQQNVRTLGQLRQYRQESPKAAAYQKHFEQQRKGGSGFNLGTILSAAPKVASLAPYALQGPMGLVESQVVKNVGEHAAGTTKALITHPAAIGHTFSSLPTIANSLAMQGVRAGEETGLAAAHSFGIKTPKGTGEPGKTFEEFIKQAVSSTAHTVGENQKEVEDEVKREGAANQILTYLPAGAGVGAVAGKLAAKGAEGLAGPELAALRASRAATMAKAKAAAMGADQGSAHMVAASMLAGNPEALKFLQGGPPKLGLIKRGKAYIAESTQARPLLRQAPGERKGVKPEVPLRTQSRSNNLFRGMSQTAIDNARRTYELKTLQRVARERQTFLGMHPHLHGDSVPVDYGQHLSTLTRQGEVTPLFQPGGLEIPGLSRFMGAEKAQRMNVGYTGSDTRRLAETARIYAHNIVAPAVEKLDKYQRRILVLAKEGHFPLHDPLLAQYWLQEISRQAKAGGGLIPLVHRMMGSDVGKQVDSVLARMEEKGPASVVTPEFQKLVERVPDERLMSPHDPILQQIPDQVGARKYLPQQQTLEEWAKHELTKSNPHPDAQSTLDAIKQIHEKLAEGERIRDEAKRTEGGLIVDRNGVRWPVSPLHDDANTLFAEAKNLADENAKRHGLPTDRAYVKHQRTRGHENWLHTVGRRAPAAERKTEYELQRKGYRSTDPRLIEDGLMKSIRNTAAIDNITRVDEANRVPGVPHNLTSVQAQQWMARLGLNPDHYEVANLGRLPQLLAERQLHGADLHHLDLNPADHSKVFAELMQGTRGVHPGDITTGAGIYPKAALDELHGNLNALRLPSRAYGQLKGRFSAEMLGTSPAWATTMSLLTYPSQAILGGSMPWEWAGSSKWYRGLPEANKRLFDIETGTDNPFSSSHEGRMERLGSSTKPLGRPAPRLEDMLNTMHLWRTSPVGRMLANSVRVDRLILKLERGPRRYARIAVATKHMKGMALDKMLEQAKGVMASQSKLEKALIRLQHLGRMAPDEYMKQVMESKPLMEEVAQKTQGMMGEWHKMTTFERNTLSKVVLFYPWVRYSLRLAFKSLPSNHPLLYPLGGQLGVMSREEMRHLLGVDAPIGKAPIGREQPGLEPSEREWMWAGASQVDPILNVVTDLLSGKPSQILGVPPPFISALLEYFANRSGFTGKPLKVSEPYKRGGKEENWPDFLPYYINKTLIQPFAPTRALAKNAAGGRPQAEESLFGSKPMHYSPKIEAKIEEEREAEHNTAYNQIAKYVLPLLPHKEPGLLNQKIKEAEEEKKKEEEKEAGGLG